MLKLCTDETPLEEAPLSEVPQWYIKKLVAIWRRQHWQEEHEVHNETPVAEWPAWRLRAYRRAKEMLQDPNLADLPMNTLRDEQR